MSMPKVPTFLLRASVKQMIKEKGLDGTFAMFESQKNNYNIKEGKKYPSTLAEVMDLIHKVPELNPLKDRLLSMTKEQREKAGLPV